MYRCGFVIIEQTAQNIQKRRTKGHTTTAAVVGGLQTGFAAGQGWGRLSLPHLCRWRGWSACSALRLCVGRSSSVSKERETSLLISKIVCWLLRVCSKELICAASGTLDDASACLPWAIPQSVHQEPGTLFGRVLECCICRLVCPGCPVEDDVCLDVLVSWLPGRLFIFLYGILPCFFSLANWAITLH